MKFYALEAEYLDAITRENKPTKRQGGKTAKLNKINAMIQNDGIFLPASAGPRKIQLVGSISSSKATVLTSRTFKKKYRLMRMANSLKKNFQRAGMGEY